MQKQLLLIGGGHAHLFVLETLRRQRTAMPSGWQITLLARDLLTPYSGMLPGLLAGHYRRSECHVALAPLAAAAGVALEQATIDRLDLAAGTVHAGERVWHFDAISLDVGSTVPLTVPGAQGRALGVRPIDAFLAQWRQLQQQIDSLTRPVHVVLVGGGAGGVEVVLAMAHRLRGSQAHHERVKFSLVTRGPLLPGYPRRVARRMMRHLAAAGIAVQTEAEATRVDDGVLHFADGSSAAFDALLWATGSAAQPWLAASGLDCVDGGFVEINDFLQSTSHPQVFAAGDIATHPRRRRPKAGVFAVRQGPVLATNLLRHMRGERLNAHRPQSDYLSLISTGRRHAVASWYGLVWEGDWAWRWKDAIDRRFMGRFSGTGLG